MLVLQAILSTTLLAPLGGADPMALVAAHAPPIFAVSAQLADPVKLVHAELAREFKNWPKKSGKAYEHKDADSNYRVWKPLVTKTPAGDVLISFKMDHIRGFAKDDHASISFLVKPTGAIDDVKVSIQIQGEGTKSVTMQDVLSKLPAEQPKGGYDKAKTFAAVADVGVGWVQSLSEGGGRLRFPSVMEVDMNRMANAAVLGLKAAASGGGSGGSGGSGSGGGGGLDDITE